MSICGRQNRVEPCRQNEPWADIQAATRRYALNRTRQADLADDIAQQAVLGAIEYQQSHIVISLHALAFRIADNLIKGHFRRLKPSDNIDLMPELACAQPLPDRVTEDRAETRAMLKVLSQMPPLRRDVFLRRRLEGQSCEDIGRALKLNTKAVEKHITRALADMYAARRLWRATEAAPETRNDNIPTEERAV
ncbi:MAG: sigma-70 family RNA polymerase sigma factor [Asticcacaulis sp.]